MSKYNLNTKLISMLSACVLMGTPVMANASETEEDNSNENIKVYAQEYVFTPLDTVEFDNVVGDFYNYVTGEIKYTGDLRRDIQSLVYLVNHKYITKEDAYVILDSIVFGETNLEGEFANVPFANDVINQMNIFNQVKIRTAKSSDELIDPSRASYGEEDAKLLHSMFDNCFNAYDETVKRDIVDFADDSTGYFMKTFRQLTGSSLKGDLGNVYNLSVGARWYAWKSVGSMFAQLMRDYLTTNYTKAELAKYFDLDGLSKDQLIPLATIYEEDECIEVKEGEPLSRDAKLSLMVKKFKQLWVVIYDNIYNELYTILSVDCNTNTK